MLDSILPKPTLAKLRLHPQRIEQTINAQVVMLVDTHVKQVLEIVELQKQHTEDPYKVIDPDPDNLPDVTYTRIVHASFAAYWECETDKIDWNDLLVKLLELVWHEKRLSSVADLRKLCPGVLIEEGKPRSKHFTYMPDLDFSVNRASAKNIHRVIVKTVHQFGWHFDLMLEASSKSCKLVPPGEQFQITVPGAFTKVAANSKQQAGR